MKTPISLALALYMLAGQALAQADYEVPRTIDGHPDLQGVWENNTITPVERPDVFGDKEYLTDDDVVFINQRIGQIMAEGGRDSDDIVMADLDLDLIREVRNTWQFFRDRRPETYQAIVEL